MKGSVVGPLILKDWHLNRRLISLSVAGGLIALVVSQRGGENAHILGGVWFFVVLCILASMLPGSTIVSERKKQTLAFVMSLPVSSIQYTIAKVVSTLAMFLVPWLALLISALVFVETGHTVPHGRIPTLIILAMLPLIGFCLMSATALVGESEGWLIAGSIVCNSSYWFVWYLISRVPALRDGWFSPVAVWNQAALSILYAEFGFIGLIVVLTLFLQTRKRDFVY